MATGQRGRIEEKKRKGEQRARGGERVESRAGESERARAAVCPWVFFFRDLLDLRKRLFSSLLTLSSRFFQPGKSPLYSFFLMNRIVYRFQTIPFNLVIERFSERTWQTPDGKYFVADYRLKSIPLQIKNISLSITIYLFNSSFSLYGEKTISVYCIKRIEWISLYRKYLFIYYR